MINLIRTLSFHLFRWILFIIYVVIYLLMLLYVYMLMLWQHCVTVMLIKLILIELKLN